MHALLKSESTKIYLKTVKWPAEYIMMYLKYFLKGHRLDFYGPFDPKFNPHLCLDTTYPPAKFHADC